MKKQFNKIISLVLVLVIFSGMLPVAILIDASAESIRCCEIAYPRGTGGVYSWGHDQNHFMNGYTSFTSNYTSFHSIDGYSKIGYCLEPGTKFTEGQSGRLGNDQISTVWNKISMINSTLTADQARDFVCKILANGFDNGSTSMTSLSDDQVAHAYATQLLLWEAIVGERDGNFNHINPTSGKNAVCDMINTRNHPLKSSIYSYYNSIAKKVQKCGLLPSFCLSNNPDDPYKLEYSNGYFTVVLTDTNEVLDDFYSVNQSTC